MKKALFLMTLIAVSTLFLMLIINSSLADSNTVLIKVGDLYFKPDTIQLKAGQEVKIELVNEGKIEHEFMVGREVKMEEDGDNTHHNKMHESEEKETSESEQGHHTHKGNHSTHPGMSATFENDFFKGIDISVKTENGAELMGVPDHGTMVTLKPDSKATLNFKVPTNRKGEWEVACFVPGHYEAAMKGKIVINYNNRFQEGTLKGKTN